MSQAIHTHAIEHTHADEQADDAGHAHRSDDGHDEAGLVWEQWVLRSLLFSVVGLVTASIVTSLGDIRRYIHIKRL